MPDKTCEPIIFDRYIGIDWSGALSPMRSNKIAMATCSHSSPNAPLARTESLSRNDVYTHILKLGEQEKSYLIGIDCNLGYCYGVGENQFGKSPNYQLLWNSVEDICCDQTNFFAGPFWQSPANENVFWTKGKQPAWFNLDNLRRSTEKAATAQGLGIPESPFKLIGAKQVGKGGLAGMRMVLKLKQELGDRLAIWPFEAISAKNTKIVITEIYPRLFIRHAGFGNAKIREASQLNAVLHHFELNSENNSKDLSDHLTDAIIASAGLRWFCKQGNALSQDKLPREAIEFEGWIFGVEP